MLPKKQIRVAEKKSRKALEGSHLRGLFLFHINNFYRGYLYANTKSTQNRLKIALQKKGRLSQDCAALLKQCGVKINWNE